jgi:predicted metal-dependent phosphoesterase TrpH
VSVLAITCHEACLHRPELERYAAERDLVLIPGIELNVEGKHVLMLNPDEEQVQIRSFDALREMRGRGEFTIAPHPYYPSLSSLGRKLVENIDLFDAVEFCSFYYPLFSFNRKAVAVAERYGKPLLGTSDTHFMPYEARTCTLVEAEPTRESVMAALREGRVRLRTRSASWRRAFQMVRFGLFGGPKGSVSDAPEVMDYD